uniref:hypothetical protein n=1 Tax=Priestia megaterium TaxID=1404 RepID=UPI0030F4A1A6
DVFKEYLLKKCNINNTKDSLESYLSELTISTVLLSMEYYVETRSIKGAESARLYISVMREFLKYINKKEDIKNTLIESFSYDADYEDSFSYMVRKKIEELGLKESESLGHINFSSFEKLVEECNTIIDKASTESVFKLHKPNAKYYSEYRYFTSALIVKLILFSGVKFQVIPTIKNQDLNFDHNTIKINNYIIHLPTKLSDQFKKYKEIKQKISPNTDSFFIEYNGEAFIRNGDVGNILKIATGKSDKKGSTSTISMSKFAIINMIRKGINQYTIKKFTGYKDKVILDCQEIVDKERLESKNRYLDTKLRGIKTFDIL